MDHLSARLLSAAAVSSLGVFLALPASAAVFICTGNNCVSTDENVLVDAGTGPAITGETNTTGVGVTFTSSIDTALVGDANGQADIGSADGLLNALTFTLDSGYGFTAATFNLFPLPGNQANEATSVFITYLLPGGTEQQITQAINTNGQNFIGIYGTEGEVFTSAGFVANPGTTGIQDMRQVRLAGVQQLSVGGAVPEPSTWAMMLFGFGAVGFAMRRRKEGTGSTRVRFALG